MIAVKTLIVNTANDDIACRTRNKVSQFETGLKILVLWPINRRYADINEHSPA